MTNRTARGQNPQVRIPHELVPYVMLLIHLHKEGKARAILQHIKETALTITEEVAA